MLPQSTPQKPKVAVFATSDARTQFHLLEESDPESEMQSAAITADVRFADSKMMGMYPERPVVTRVYHKALLSVPVELVQSEIEGLTGVPPEGGFSGVLDKLYKTATGTDVSAEGVTPENQPSDDKSSEQLFPDVPPANGDAVEFRAPSPLCRTKQQGSPQQFGTACRGSTPRFAITSGRLRHTG